MGACVLHLRQEIPETSASAVMERTAHSSAPLGPKEDATDCYVAIGLLPAVGTMQQGLCRKNWSPPCSEDLDIAGVMQAIFPIHKGCTAIGLVPVWGPRCGREYGGDVPNMGEVM